MPLEINMALGYSRVVDYLETLENADTDKIVVTGHSRGGKTALLDFSDYNFFGKALPGDFYKENFARVDSLITGKSPIPLVWGCMDSTYREFNPLATAELVDSCVVPCPANVSRQDNHSARGDMCYSN